MVLEFPVCPACHRAFDIAGVFRPKGDQTDIVGFAHHEGRCLDVYGRAQDDPSLELLRLGTTEDYSDLLRVLQESAFRADIDLRPDGRVPRLRFGVRQWLRRQRRRWT